MTVLQTDALTTLASGALKNGASGGTRTPVVCIPLYKSGAVAAEPHWQKKFKLRVPGFEPRSTRWQRAMLAIAPYSHLFLMSNNNLLKQGLNQGLISVY